MILQFRYYMATAIVLGVVSALGDWRYRLPNPVPYATGGAGFLGDFAYLFLLILGKWVE